MRRSSYLAFDLGGSGGKLMLCGFDGERLRLEEAQRFASVPVAANGCLYWEVLGILREMNRGIAKAARMAGSTISSIGIDSFSNDFGLVDARGELLCPVRCYRDSRTVRHAEAIYAKMSRERLYTITGNQAAPFNTLMQLAAMREAGQGFLLDNARRLLFTPDLLVQFMTGEQVTEYTMASVSQMYDLAKADWSDEILGTFGIPRSLLCDPVQPGSIVGTTSRGYERELGIGTLRVVSVCEHDTASAFLAASSPGPRAIISSGTWSLVGTEVAAPIVEARGFAHNIANEGGLPGRQRLLRNVMGLWMVQELRRQHEIAGRAYSIEELEGAALAAPAFAHSVDPDDQLFFSPPDMIEALSRRCAERGGSAPRGIGEELRCVYESLALKHRWALDRIEELCGSRLPVIDLVGGGSRSALLCQLTADACGRPVRAGPAEATALGNILVQLLADRAIASIEEGHELIRSSFPIKEYLPHDQGLWEEKYAEFESAFALG